MCQMNNGMKTNKSTQKNFKTTKLNISSQLVSGNIEARMFFCFFLSTA